MDAKAHFIYDNNVVMRWSGKFEQVAKRESRSYRVAVRWAVVRKLILLDVHQKRDQLVIDVRRNRTVLF